jgi:acetylornithine deacetylase/succinyl-diaminopimelate desuccinylase-like protein
VTIDVQKPRGSFNLQFVDGLTQHYRDITNIIVKLESSLHGSNDALLVNCHFDSVPQSPGASDDAVSCAIMIEALEVITQADKALKNNVIFLFNGAEENMLPGKYFHLRSNHICRRHY